MVWFRLERALRIGLGVFALWSLDQVMAVGLTHAHVRFPSSVAGMLVCFAALAVLRALDPGAADRVTSWLAPAGRFLGRWMALFFVPPLVLLPLTQRPSSSDLVRLVVIVGGGFVATLLATAFVVRALGVPSQARAEVTDASTADTFWSRRQVLSLWVWLSAVSVKLSPLVFGVALTICCFVGAETIREHAARRGFPNLAKLCHPVLLGALGTIAGYRALGFSLQAYLLAAPAVSFAAPGNALMAALPPAVVALGLALDAQRRVLRAGAFTLLLGTSFATCFSLFGTALAARALGLASSYGSALLPRSVTTPIALAIADMLHANPGLTAVCVISTGVLGAIFAEPILMRFNLAAPFVLGIATGASSHGIGTAALARDNPVAAALSSISFALTAVLSVLLVSVAPLRGLLLSLTR